MISFELGIILTILIKLTECEWVQYGSYNFNIPGHIYKVTCRSGATISGSATWSDTSDLDIYIYS